MVVAVRKQSVSVMWAVENHKETNCVLRPEPSAELELGHHTESKVYVVICAEAGGRRTSGVAMPNPRPNHWIPGSSISFSKARPGSFWGAQPWTVLRGSIFGDKAHKMPRVKIKSKISADSSEYLTNA